MLIQPFLRNLEVCDRRWELEEGIEPAPCLKHTPTDLPERGSDGNRTLDLLVRVENTGLALPFDQTRIPAGARPGLRDSGEG